MVGQESLPHMSRQKNKGVRGGHFCPPDPRRVENGMSPFSNRITPIVLAAGDSSRMGFPKALLPLGNATFLSQILMNLQPLGLESPIVILGKHASLIKQRLGLQNAHVIVNPRPEGGQISSVRLAVASLGLYAEGCLIWPVDHPLIPTSLVRQLVDLFRETEASIVLPACKGRLGHPAIFGRQLFSEILHSPLEEGLKTIVRQRGESLVTLPTGEPSTIEDIDTPEDYHKITGLRLDDALNPRRSG